MSRPRGTARRSLNISASDENVNPTTGEDVSNRENEVPSSRLTATKKRAMLEAVVSRKRILADRSNQAASVRFLPLLSQLVLILEKDLKCLEEQNWRGRAPAQAFSKSRLK